LDGGKCKDNFETTASPLPGVITSFQEQVEWHLRIASLLVGLAVGVLSLIGLWRKLRERR
jgi:hypothetical protein